MFNIGPEKVMMVLFIALIVLGPDKLPNAARQIGKYLNEFRRISQGFQNELRNAIDMADVHSDPTTNRPPTSTDDEPDSETGDDAQPGPTLAPAAAALTEPEPEPVADEPPAAAVTTPLPSAPVDTAPEPVEVAGTGDAPVEPVEAPTNGNGAAPVAPVGPVEAPTNGKGAAPVEPVEAPINGTASDPVPAPVPDNDIPAELGIPRSVWELDSNNAGQG